MLEPFFQKSPKPPFLTPFWAKMAIFDPFLTPFLDPFFDPSCQKGVILRGIFCTPLPKPVKKGSFWDPIFWPKNDPFLTPFLDPYLATLATRGQNPSIWSTFRGPFLRDRPVGPRGLQKGVPKRGQKWPQKWSIFDPKKCHFRGPKPLFLNDYKGIHG